MKTYFNTFHIKLGLRANATKANLVYFIHSLLMSKIRIDYFNTFSFLLYMTLFVYYYRNTNTFHSFMKKASSYFPLVDMRDSCHIFLIKDMLSRSLKYDLFLFRVDQTIQNLFFLTFFF